MKNKNKVIVVVLCAIFVFSSLTAPVFAQNENITKEESVYVISDANGNVNKKIVSSTLKNTRKGEKIEDKSNLKNVENIKGNEKFDKRLNKLVWTSQGKDITYQGISNKKLPVNIKLTYYLNGERISPANLAHKSGRLKIRIDYSNNTFDNNVFMAVTGMILDYDKVSNVKVTNGKSVEEGENILVVGYGFPGLDESLSMKGIDITNYTEIESDVKDFTMDGTMSYVTNEVFKDINIDDIDSIMDLTSSLEKLSSSSQILVEGSKSLNEGINTLIDKSGTLTTGVNKLNKGAKSLASGGKQLKTGVNNIKSGAETLSGNIDVLSDGINDAKNGAIQLKNGLNTAGSSLNETIKYNEQVLGGIKNTISQLKQTDSNNPLIPNLEQMAATLEQTISNQKLISLNLTSKGDKTLMGGADKLENGLNEIYEGSTQLKTQGSDKIALGANDLINKGINPLIQGSEDLSEGLNTLQQGSDKLIKGIDELEKGSKQLSEGMSRFDKEGIEKLVQAAGSLDNLKVRIHNTIDKADDYNTFSGLSKGMNGSVKFVYKTDSIE